jgi:hypothetical protein
MIDGLPTPKEMTVTRLFTVTVAEHPIDDNGYRPPGTDTVVEVRAYSMLLIRGQLMFSTEAGFALKEIPFRQVRGVKIKQLEEPEFEVEVETVAPKKKTPEMKAKKAAKKK